MNYYPGLNALRALAALCVIPSHIEQMKKHSGMAFDHWFPIPGIYGVILFFALSGFLITSLLLEERRFTGKIVFKRFYIKRALRIWPLYFLIYAVSLFVLNRIDLFAFLPNSETVYETLDLKSVILIIIIFPNFLASSVPYAAHSWSIGVEEQFYLVQPALISMARRRYLVVFSMAAIIFSPELLAMSTHFVDSTLLHKIAANAKFYSCIAIGSLTAYLHLYHSRLLDSLVQSPLSQIFLLIIFFGLMVFENYLGPGNRGIIDFRIYATLFSALILVVGTSERKLWLHSNKTLNYIGKISYGIYMFHPMCIGIVLVLMNIFLIPSSNFTVNILLYPCSIALTLVVSGVSYKYLEGYFRSIKQRLGLG